MLECTHVPAPLAEEEEAVAAGAAAEDDAVALTGGAAVYLLAISKAGEVRSTHTRITQSVLLFSTVDPHW